MRIDQVIPTIVMRDAVSNHTLEAQRVLRGLGFESDIYAQNIGVELLSRVRPARDLDPRPAKGRSLLYQASIGSPVADSFAACHGPKLLNYHNITPVEMIGWWEPHLAGELELGRRQLDSLARVTSLAIAVSAYNEAELIEVGYARTAVAPFLGDFTSTAPPDAAVSARLAAADAGGGAAGAGAGTGANWLFVGQIAPHKAQHDVIKALAFYRAAYDPAARLRIIGRESSPRYTAALRRLVRDLRLESAVLFEGSVSEAAKASHFRHADVFVGCSAHEGFCAPLIEAMQHELPIVAYGAAAVPETVAGAGIVLHSKEPSIVAAAVHRVLSDPALRRHLVETGRARAREFSIEAARTRFASVIKETVNAA